MAFTLIFMMEIGKKSCKFSIVGVGRDFPKIEIIIISEPYIITTWNFLWVKPFAHNLGMHKNNSPKMHNKLI